MKKIIASIFCLFFPSKISVLLLRLLGYKVGKQVKIGFSLVYCNSILIMDGGKIGHLNVIAIDSLIMQRQSYIGSLNVIKGPIQIILDEIGAIGKSNFINRGKLGITYGIAILKLGKLSKITAFHYIDLTRSITFGDYSTLAGVRSQIWTHGYMHANEGPGRFRVDGDVNIGDNVYIGTGSIINPGVNIANSINIGGNSSIAKSLLEPGMYVSQPLRYISKDYEQTKSKLTRVKSDNLVEEVYEK